MQIFLDYRHPVNTITKNALVPRDIDILKPLAKENLVSVALSIPTINKDLRRTMEPRISSSKNKLHAVEELTKNGIPVHIMIATIIPGLNSDEILSIMKETSEAGALSTECTLVKLNDTVEPVFVKWIETYFPDRKDKVLNLIRSMREGNVGKKDFITIMREKKIMQK